MAEIAPERGVDPVEAMLDLAIEKDLERFFVHPVANEKQDTVLEMMRHPRAVVTFSDFGAHVSQIIDSSLQIHLLSHRVRERQAFTLEQAVRMLTLVPATHWGFSDRGLVREGFVADLFAFDPDTIASEMPEVTNDLPPAPGGWCSGRGGSPHRGGRRGALARWQAHGGAARAAPPGGRITTSRWHRACAGRDET